MAEEYAIDSQVLSSIRSPLMAHTNTKSIKNAAKSAQRIRRKSSFARHLDSSESVPSSHDSIFAAEYLSPRNSDDSGYKTDKRKATNSLRRPLSIEEQPTSLLGNDEHSDEGLPVGNTPIIYGHGTALSTIIEQKSSSATMRTAVSTPSPARTLTRPRSTSDLSSSPASASTHRQPPKASPVSSPIKREFSISGMIHRLASFSDEDVNNIKLSWPEGYNPNLYKDANRPKGAFKSSLDSENHETQDNIIHEIYAQPLLPLQPPLVRPSTPPGMPSWTAAQQRRPRVAASSPSRSDGFHRATARVQRFFGYQPSSQTVIPARRASGHASSHGLCVSWDRVPGQRRSVSAPNVAVSGAPRFRPPRSGHGVSALEMHPFARADTVPTKTRTQEATTTGRRVVTAFAGPSRTASETVRSRHVKAKGKRKAGQKVRFTPSTSDVNGISQMRPSQPTLEGRTTSCLHRHVSLPNLPSQEVSTHQVVPTSPLLGDTLVAQTLPGGCLENNPDNLPTSPLLPEFLAQMHSNVMEMSSELSLKPKTRKCWKCRMKAVLKMVDEVWDSSAMWCCWHCCGIDVLIIGGDAASRERLRS